MTNLTHGQLDARESARSATGTFGTQEHSTPEVTIPPKQLGMIGLGPKSVNTFAEPLDAGTDFRPARPYLPLTPGDDDEVFDAPVGTRIVVIAPTGTRIFEREGDEDWFEESVLRDVVTFKCSTGEVWEAMFADDGSMHSSLLSAPLGCVFDDRRGFVTRDSVDKPLTYSEAMSRLSGARRGQLVSLSTFGDLREDGIPEFMQGPLNITITDDGYLTIAAGDKVQWTSRSFWLDSMKAYDRDGDLVLRREVDFGYGWEETLRLNA